jgi:nucleotide-binding universal stress UspA family protein
MKTLFQHILVPVDFTTKNRAAIDVARPLARQSGAKVTLLHVIELVDFPDDDEMRSFYDKLQSRSDEELDKLLALFAGEDFDIGVDTIINHRSKGIALYAADNDADLIVMSSHPFDPNQPGEGLGTISYQVSALCRCSIILIKQASTIDGDTEG